MLSFIFKSILTLLLCLFTLPAFAKNTILILGDSLSSGYGMQTEQSWVTLLNKRLQSEGYGYQIINLSVSGATTSNVLAIVSKALAEHRPTITIIEIGGNDGLRGLQLVTIQKNLQRIITLIKQANSKILLLGVRLPPNYGEQYTKGFEKIFVDLARKNNIELVPNFLNKVDDHPALMSEDGIHPNVKAQTILLDNIWPSLKKLIA